MRRKFMLICFALCLFLPVKNQQMLLPLTSNMLPENPLKENAKVKTGRASWYGPGFDGKLTANGERYNMYGVTAAHKTMRFGTKVKITNLANGKSVIVKINDRGPYIKGRDFDLSKGAFKKIAAVETGVIKIKYEILKK